jgi:hypothetical protein
MSLCPFSILEIKLFLVPVFSANCSCVIDAANPVIHIAMIAVKKIFHDCLSSHGHFQSQKFLSEFPFA